MRLVSLDRQTAIILARDDSTGNIFVLKTLWV